MRAVRASARAPLESALTMCDSSCSNCNGACANHAGPGAKPEKASCQSCPNRLRCHGKPTVVTQETVMRLVRDAVLEVLRERGL